MTRSPEAVRDEWLVLRCQDGDPVAFDELVGRWQGRLWRHAVRLAGANETAADAVQEAWLAIVRGLGRLDDPASFSAWALRIVANKVTDALRRGVRDRDVRRRLEGDSTERAGDDVEGARDLREALRRLPRDRRAILELRYLDELSTAEIAAVLDLPEGTVKSRLYHARNQLKHVLEQD